VDKKRLTQEKKKRRKFENQWVAIDPENTPGPPDSNWLEGNHYQAQKVSQQAFTQEAREDL
jgi:hypothetical protein